jgi:hypothetical protein
VLRDVVSGILVHQRTIRSGINQKSVGIVALLSCQCNIIGSDTGTFVHAAEKESGTEKHSDYHAIFSHFSIFLGGKNTK